MVGPKHGTTTTLDVLDYDVVMARLDEFSLDWLATNYVTALELHPLTHARVQSYKAALVGLHDRDVYRTMACGIAGLSVAADSCLLLNMRN